MTKENVLKYQVQQLTSGRWEDVELETSDKGWALETLGIVRGNHPTVRFRLVEHIYREGRSKPIVRIMPD